MVSPEMVNSCPQMKELNPIKGLTCQTTIFITTNANLTYTVQRFQQEKFCANYLNRKRGNLLECL